MTFPRFFVDAGRKRALVLCARDIDNEEEEEESRAAAPIFIPRLICPSVVRTSGMTNDSTTLAREMGERGSLVVKYSVVYIQLTDGMITE